MVGWGNRVKSFQLFLIIFHLGNLERDSENSLGGGGKNFFSNLYSTIFDHDLFPIIFFKFNFTINFLDAKALFVKKMV